MTTSATFVINGCERVIVSQIIRSPGVYFEKNKNQKKRKTIKRKLPSDINKLRSFVPLGESFVSEQTLSFFPNPYNQSTFQYSFNQLKKNEKDFYYLFLDSFKIYTIISKTLNSSQKIKRVKLFLYWLTVKNKKFSHSDYLSSLVKEWHSLLKLLIKYEFLTRILTNNYIEIEDTWLEKINQNSSNLKMLSAKNQKIVKYYNK